MKGHIRRLQHENYVLADEVRRLQQIARGIRPSEAAAERPHLKPKKTEFRREVEVNDHMERVVT